MRTVAEEMVRLLDKPPQLVPGSLRDGTRLTRLGQHADFHGYVPGMADNLLVGYYQGEHDVTGKIENKRFSARVRAGMFGAIAEGHDGQWHASGPIEVSHVYLTSARLQACSDMIAGGRRVELLDRVGCADPTVASILEILSREAGANDPSSRLFVERAIDLLCIQLLRHHSTFETVRMSRPRRGLARWQVKRVTAYMRDHLDQEVGLDELAKLVRLSRFHFCTAFRLATGRTPHEWLVAQRIERARDLLAQTVLPVSEVGLAVGYVTPSSFAASFRKLVGATPTEFRRGL